MSAPVYPCIASAVSLTASTAKTVIGVKAHANSGINVLKMRGSFNSVTAADQPVLVEVGYCTFATNAPGTNSTSLTPPQWSGRVLTIGFTAGKTWTTEPTAITVIDNFYVPPNGTFLYDVPLSTEPDTALGEGLVLRCTPGASATSLNFAGGMFACRI